MVLDKRHPGKYIDNIIFKYNRNNIFSAKSFYGKIKIKLQGKHLTI